MSRKARSGTRRSGRAARFGCLGCLGSLLGTLATLFLTTAVFGAVAVRFGCPPPATSTTSASSASAAPLADDLFPAARRRTEDSTYLTFPEWYIVYSAEEYARWVQTNRPSGFPFFRSIGQYWCGYTAVSQLTRDRYPLNVGNHLMLVVIGTSYSAEYALKGVYENTVGRLTEWLSDGGDTAEDRFATEVADDYGAFLNQVPWYKYPFDVRLRELWSQTGGWGRHPVRKWERKLVLSAEYAGKAGYGWLMGVAAGAVYDEDATHVLVWAQDLPLGSAELEGAVRLERQVDARTALLVLPRFTAFRDTLLQLPPGQGRLLAIAGNDEILITTIAPREWRYDLPAGDPVFEQVLLTDPARQRVAITLPVAALLDTLQTLRAQGIIIEHIYDY